MMTTLEALIAAQLLLIRNREHIYELADPCNDCHVGLVVAIENPTGGKKAFVCKHCETIRMEE